MRQDYLISPMREKSWLDDGDELKRRWSEKGAIEYRYPGWFTMVLRALVGMIFRKAQAVKRFNWHYNPHVGVWNLRVVAWGRRHNELTARPSLIILTHFVRASAALALADQFHLAVIDRRIEITGEEVKTWLAFRRSKALATAKAGGKS